MRQLPRFYSWRPDLEAQETDAFLQDWSNLLGFSSSVVFNLEGAGKNTVGEGNGGVAYPTVANPSLVPTLIEMIVDFPIILPRQEILARQQTAWMWFNLILPRWSFGRSQAETWIRTNFRESYH